MLDLAHIHPMLVHFPLALLPLAVAIMLAALAREGRLAGRSCLQTSAMTLSVLAALAAVAAAVFGDMAAEAAISAGFAESAIETHESLGITSAALLALLALGHLWLYWRRPAGRKLDALVLAGGIVLLGLILVTAYYGGALVYTTGVNVEPVLRAIGA